MKEKVAKKKEKEKRKKIRKEKDKDKKKIKTQFKIMMGIYNAAKTGAMKLV